MVLFIYGAVLSPFALPYCLNLYQVCVSTISIQSTHLDCVKFMAEVLKQHLHTAVVAVSHEYAVLVFSTEPS